MTNLDVTGTGATTSPQPRAVVIAAAVAAAVVANLVIYGIGRAAGGDFEFTKERRERRRGLTPLPFDTPTPDERAGQKRYARFGPVVGAGNFPNVFPTLQTLTCSGPAFPQVRGPVARPGRSVGYLSPRIPQGGTTKGL